MNNKTSAAETMAQVIKLDEVVENAHPTTAIHQTPQPTTPQTNTTQCTSQTPTSKPNTTQTKKSGKYLPEEDLIMVREVAAVRAHIAKYGETRERFLQAANTVNQNPHMRQKVTWKAVQDRYKRLQDDFDSDDLRNHNLSGIVGGEMGELYQSLSLMREERDSFVKGKESDRSAKHRREEEKERMGRQVVEMALKRKESREGSATDNVNENVPGKSGTLQTSNDENGEESESGKNGSAKKAKLRRNGFEDMSGGLAAFGAQLREVDMARINLEREQLSFEMEKYDEELFQREQDRAECRQERQDTQKFELEKFKMMFDAFKQQRAE